MSGFNGNIEAGALHPSDVVNNLTNTATDKPISANIVNAVSSSSVTLSSGATIAFRKIGHVVCATYSGNGHAQTTAQTDTGVIPSGYIPASRVAQAITGSSGLSYCVLRSDGAVEYQNTDAWAAGTITYVV